MKVGGFNDLNTSDAGGKIAFSVFFQGCGKRCPGCHNPELQDPNGGMKIDPNEILSRISKYRKHYEAVVFIGGEPMDQLAALRQLLIGVVGLGLEVWLYTGYEDNEIPEDIACLCSVIVAGEYREDLRTGGFPVSSNQKIIDNRRGQAA
ncbi:anaerobic ribonucleoside-triphosphate reductase activating protein [Heliophilum fasciatum]|uniref:Anaerobic ribonucleoside-triphosphate reductase activating protein n=1 Tax=Heliophilum fasciatum TaxID=35700 RepID=A0A4R2REJ4_9FIRM|nr:anaerobic ribonucleoside-triphosphate reductase activating protein [Heliophilum fasciatum]